MRKKILAIALAATMVVSAAACGTDAGTTEATTTDKVSDSSTKDAETSSEEDSSNETNDESTEEPSTEEPYDYSQGFSDKGLLLGYTVSDYVVLPKDYKELVLDKKDIEITDEEMQQELDGLAIDAKHYEDVKEGTVANKDTINIDYVGKVDGVEFENGTTKGEGTSVTIGVTSYIDDFLEQLIGHEVGETFDIEVTFPDPYINNPDLAGKDAVFTVTINSIQQPGELTDEIVAEYTEGEYKTVEEYRQAVYDYYYNQNKLNVLFQTIIEETEVKEVPESIVDTYYDLMSAYYSATAVLYGMTREDFMGYYNLDDESLMEDCKEQAKNILIFQSIYEAEGYELTEEEVTEILGLSDFASAAESWGEGYLYNSAIISKVVTALGEDVVIK